MELSKILIKFNDDFKNDQENIFKLDLIKQIQNINMKQYYKNKTVSGLIDYNLFIKDFMDELHLQYIKEVFLDGVFNPI